MSQVPECGADVGTPGFLCNGPQGHKGPHAWKSGNWSIDVYKLFIEEMKGFTIKADDSAISVVERMTRAVNRAQAVYDGKLPFLVERIDRSGY